MYFSRKKMVFDYHLPYNFALEDHRPILNYKVKNKEPLHTTDSFQYKANPLLEDSDYVITSQRHNAESKNLPKYSTIKFMDPTPITKSQLNDNYLNIQGISKFRRKSDISSWSGGVSHFEIKKWVLNV